MRLFANLISAAMGADLLLFGLGLWRHDGDLLGSCGALMLILAIARGACYSIDGE